MSYLVLARKWRPRGFEDLIGQEPISRILSNAIAQGKIAHAYLFSGPRGVGKTSTARILAKAMNCEKGPTPAPCGLCSSCKGIADGSSVDVMEIDGASNNSVNDIRDLRERVKYAPAGGRFKVYIIDEAHMLSDAAFNALLKTLEEPPSHVVFVLATTASRKIPATVLSRCQHLPFRKIPILKIKERLKMISKSEAITISDSAVEMIARAAEGSMRDSLTILDQVSAFSSDINESEVKDLLGIADFGALSELSSAVISGNRRRIIELIAELTDRGTDIRSFTKDLMNFFRDLLVAKVAGRPEEILDMSENEIDAVKEILKMTEEDHLTLLLSEMIRSESDVRVAFSPRVALEMSLIRASFLTAMAPVKQAIENLESFISDRDKQPQKKQAISGLSEKIMRKESENIETPAVLPADGAPSPVDIAALPSVSPEAMEVKPLLMERLESINQLLACKLADSEVRVEGNTLIAAFNGGSAIHADSVQKNRDVIEKLASEILCRPVVLKIDIVKKKLPKKRELKEMMLSDPLIKEAIELFDGRIVDIRSAENPKNGGEDV